MYLLDSQINLLSLSFWRHHRIYAFSNSQIIQYQIALAPELVSVELPNIYSLYILGDMAALMPFQTQGYNAFSNSQIIRCHTVMALELIIMGFLLGIHSLMSTGVILVFPLAS